MYFSVHILHILQDILVMEEIDHPFYPKATLEEADAVAWILTSPQSALQKYPFKFLPLEPNEVRLKVLHTSLCQSDVLHCRGHWGQQQYPACPGHQIVGQVTHVGQEAHTLKVGDYVGVSPVRYSDNTCHYCTDSHKNTNMCKDRIYLYGQYFGGYATHVQIDHNWAIKVPEGLHNRLHEIPPILCAGVTVYAPLKRYARPGAKCAVIGIGGLGHLAIQYANKLGMNVTAFTTRTNNPQPLLSLGATEVQHSVDEQQLQKNEGKYDVVISTVYIDNSLHHRLHQRLTKAGGVFIMVGVPRITTPYYLDNEYLVNNEIIVAGSNVGSIREVAQVLEFSSHYGVVPINEYYSFEQFNKAFHRLEHETPRYRACVNVTDWAKQHGFDK